MNPQKLTPTQLSAKDISRNIAVTAGAGSGKTEVLTQRLVHIFERNRSLRIQNVLVLTFTEKAAGEMRNRFRQSLVHQLSQPKQGEKEKKHWRDLQKNFDENWISTIHAFCAAVLRRYPIESDTDPSFGILEGFDMRSLLQDSISTVLHRKSRDPEDRNIGVLLEIWKRSALMEVLFDLVQKRWETREWIERYKSGAPDQLMAEVLACRDDLLSEFLTNKELTNLYRKFESYGPDITGTREDSFCRARMKYLGLLNTLLKNSPALPPDQSLEVIRQLKKVRKPGAPTKAWSRDGLSLKESIDQLNTLLAHYPLATFSHAREEKNIRILKSLAVLLSECLKKYRNRKKENQCLDFEDLQIETALLLANHPKIRQELATQFRYIMVDEFQDTNHLQWGVIRPIASNDNEKLSRDKLFIVGDEKQSIYSFRGADVTTFGHARKELVLANRKSGAPETLPQQSGKIVFEENFRSSEKLIRFNNTFFNHLFTRLEGYEPYEAQPQVLRSGREKPGGSVELLLVNKSDDMTESYRKEARMIARRIHRIKTKCLPQYKDITRLLHRNEPAVAILFRRRTHLKVYEEALREIGLNFTVIGGQGFFQRQEIKDFSNILDFLVCPQNSIALAGVLRSPLTGISDDALFTLSRFEGNTLWDKIQRIQKNSETKQLEISDEKGLYRGKELIKSWLRMRDRMNLSELIRTIIDESGYAITLSKDDPSAWANVEKLIAMARKFERTPWRGIKEFAALLNEQIVLEEKEGGSKNVTGGAIQLLTIHQSKGLEFPLVIIPDLSNDFFSGIYPSYYLGKLPLPASSPENLPENGVHKMELGIKIPDPDENFSAKDTFFRSLLFNEFKKKNLAELKRLLYVAATRAQNHLIFAGQINLSKDKNPKKTLDDCRNVIEWLQLILNIESPSQKSAQIPSSEGTVFVPIAFSQETEPKKTHPQPEISRQPITVLYETQKVLQNLAEVKRTGPIRLSPTALSCYASCPRCYFLRYILGATTSSSPFSDIEDNTSGITPERNKKSPLKAILRGLVAHSLFEDGIFDNQGIIRHRILSLMRLSGQFVGEENPVVKTLCQEVSVNLQNYRDSDTFHDASKNFYNEVPFEVEIGKIKLFGIIDKIYRSNMDGALKILDFKTNAVSDLHQASREVQRHRYDLQVYCYCMAAEKAMGEKIRKAHLFFSHIPSKNREIVISFDDNARNKLLSYLDSLTNDIEKASFPPFLSSACDSCSYKLFCEKCRDATARDNRLDGG